MTASIVYSGELRCEATHLQSHHMIETDAPTDNKGKGQKFSPTDLLCVALGTCIITTMAIKAGDMGVNLDGTKLEITKHMAADPRRVAQVDVKINLPALQEAKDKIILERVGHTCPVQRSLHPDVIINLIYAWGT